MEEPSSESSGRLFAHRGWAGRLLEVLALAAALAFGAGLSWREISGADIGYHLAYGDHFLDHGRIVDSNLFVYTEIAPETVKDLGPGNWFDADRRYRFPNPSYASEVVLALAHRLAGARGVCGLQALLVAGVLVLTMATMLRLGLPAALAGAALLLMAMTAYERFLHRPELFGYVFLAVELLLLTSGRCGRLWGAGLILTQWAFVQFHATWILGVAMTLPFLTEAALRAAWGAVVARKPLDDDLRRRLKWLGIVLAGQLAVAFVNPWTWRTGVLPFQMLSYLRAHQITGAAQAASTHPWAVVGEVARPLSETFAGRRATHAFAGVLTLVALGAAASLYLRRWGYLMLLGGMTLVAMTIRRNIAPTAFLLVPVALKAVAEGVSRAGRFVPARLVPPGLRRAAGTAVAAATLLLGLWWVRGVVTSRFYHAERSAWRFGSGWSRTEVPLPAGRLCRELPRSARVFTTYDTGSNLLYFARSDGRCREVPLLTNGWAFPPRVMDENFRICDGRAPFRPFADKYGVGAVVLESARSTGPLMKALAAAKEWAVARIDPRHVVFLRRSGPAGALAARHDVEANGLDLAALLARIERSDRFGSFALNNAGLLLYRLAWGDRKMGGGVAQQPNESLLRHELEWAGRAAAAWRECIRLDPDCREAATNLSMCLGLTGTARMLLMQCHLRQGRPQQADEARVQGLAHWNEAEQVLLRAIARAPGHGPFKKNLELLGRQTAAFRQGQIRIPRMP